jgi:flavin-dependent dehydrogenase
METPELFDVVIIGGGPAGTCAALRLLDLGHRVALVEQHVFPRPQIGESLSAGVRNIFGYLGAGHLLKERGYIDGLPARVIWENAKEGNVEFRNHGSGIMVDRGQLDHDMLQLAVSRGLVLFHGKPETFRKEGDHWKVVIRVKNEQMGLQTVFVLDSRGRSGSRMTDRIITAPPMVALYANTSKASMPACTLIEAQEEGWLWGSPLPGNEFRVMAFFAPRDLRKENPDKLFKSRISSSLLFQSGLRDLGHSGTKSCAVLNYSHIKPWDNNYIRIGEAAFTIDPLSSSGVEKAMRFSLQTVIAVNTILTSGNTEISKGFFEDHMGDSVIRHMKWTASFYQSAWHGRGKSFWEERSQVKFMAQHNETAFCRKLMLKLQGSPHVKKDSAGSEGGWPAKAIDHLWYEKIRLSPQVTYVKAVCVEDDRLQLKDALKHPAIDREIAYIDNIPIFPLINRMQGTETLGELIYSWSRGISVEKAKEITVTLCKLGLLEIS